MPPQPNGPEKIAYKGKMFEIVHQPMEVGEKEIVFESARRAPGVRLIIPMRDGTVLLTREYRPSLKSYDFRLPGGKVFDSLEEFDTHRNTSNDMCNAARAAAIKEAREEVGIITDDLELFALSKAGASVEWDLYYFVVGSYTESTQALEDGEDITLAPTSREDVKAMCLNGRIQEDRSALMLLRFLNQGV